MKTFYVIIAVLFLFITCKKEETGSLDCQRLQNGIVAGNVQEVKAIITAFIGQLPSQTYSQQNVNNLVNAINGQCGASVTMLCFECIDTYPPQTEIRISYVGTGGPIEKTIDLSYTIPANKMIVLNMHD